MVYNKQTWTDSPATTSPLSAARLNNIEDGIVSISQGAFASRPGSGTNVGDEYYCTDVGNEYRWNGTSWDMTRGGDLTVFTPPPSSGWTAIGSSSVSAALDSRFNSITAGTGANWRAEYRTLTPSSNYTASFYFDWSLVLNNNISAAGVLLRSSSGQLISFGMNYNNAYNLISQKWNSGTSYNADYKVSAMTTLILGAPSWLRVRDDGTTRYLEYAYNGIDWVTWHSVLRTDFFTPNGIGWGCDAEGTGFSVAARLRSLSGVS